MVMPLSVTSRLNSVPTDRGEVMGVVSKRYCPKWSLPGSIMRRPLAKLPGSMMVPLVMYMPHRTLSLSSACVRSLKNLSRGMMYSRSFLSRIPATPGTSPPCDARPVVWWPDPVTSVLATTAVSGSTVIEKGLPTTWVSSPAVMESVHVPACSTLKESCQGLTVLLTATSVLDVPMCNAVAIGDTPKMRCAVLSVTSIVTTPIVPAKKLFPGPSMTSPSSPVPGLAMMSSDMGLPLKHCSAGSGQASYMTPMCTRRRRAERTYVPGMSTLYFTTYCPEPRSSTSPLTSMGPATSTSKFSPPDVMSLPNLSRAWMRKVVSLRDCEYDAPSPMRQHRSCESSGQSSLHCLASALSHGSPEALESAREAGKPWTIISFFSCRSVMIIAYVFAMVPV
mmetsp:Transcript_18181/g.43872  ORF Transcript_18181/g.43872 Transcript_18181/m.43872 type:complete len:393 (-) Transcript_18181:1789-2967(-)